MKQISKTQFGEVVVTMYLANTKRPTWSEGNHNHYRVKIAHKGKSHTFDFFGSTSEYEKSELSNVMDALDCFINDVDLGRYTFDDFCWAIAADRDSITDLQSFKACQRSFNAFQRLEIPQDVVDNWVDQ
jgi:hypothetical protein